MTGPFAQANQALQTLLEGLVARAPYLAIAGIEYSDDVAEALVVALA